MAQDIQIGDDYDLLIKGGDFVVDESEAQEGRLIMITAVGNWKQEPLIGVGVARWINKAITAAVQRMIEKVVQLQFAYDNKKADEVMLVVDDNKRLINLIINI